MPHHQQRERHWALGRGAEHVIQTGRETWTHMRKMAVGGKAVVELCRRSLLAEKGMNHSNVSMDEQTGGPAVHAGQQQCPAAPCRLAPAKMVGTAAVASADIQNPRAPL